MFDKLVRTPARIALPLLLLAAPAAAQEPTEQQREHVVRRGDTLWDLARAYLNNPFLWRVIYEANRGVVENPHWIYPAERLIIPGIPSESVSPPLGDEFLVPTSPVVPAESAAAPVTVSEVDLRRPVVPLAEVLATPWLTAGEQVSGRVIRLADPAAQRDRLAATLLPQSRVVLGELAGMPAAGDSFVVVRFGRRVGEFGHVVEPLGILRIDSVTPTTSMARLVRQFGDARVGDVVLPLDALPAIGLGQPEPVMDGPTAELVAFLNPEPLHATTDLAFVSAGRAAGIGIGDEFDVYVPARPAARESTEQLPHTVVGTVRVIRVTDRTSTVRVLSVTSSALQGGLPVKLVRRMP